MFTRSRSSVLATTIPLGLLIGLPSGAAGQDCIDYRAHFPAPAPLLEDIPGFGCPEDVVVSGDRACVGDDDGGRGNQRCGRSAC